MTSSNDYTSWRLTTAGGIKYKFLGTEGSFEYESGEVTWRGIIRSEDFIAFAEELFPPPVQVGGLWYSRSGTMPGWPNMIARRLRYKSIDGDSPIDALQSDTVAPAGTYHGFIEVNIAFTPGNGKASDPADPRTFLEISSNVGGEFIYAPASNTRLQDETNSEGDDDGTPNGVVADPVSGEPKGTVVSAAKRINRHPVLPSTILVPTIEWSVKWKQIPADYFRSTIIHRLRYLNGRVNLRKVPFLYNSPPETLLFAGFTHTEVYSWRTGNLEKAPVDVEIKLIEKRVLWRGVVCGHNHVWEPGLGWRRIWIGANSDEYAYSHADMNFLFKV